MSDDSAGEAMRNPLEMEDDGSMVAQWARFSRWEKARVLGTVTALAVTAAFVVYAIWQAAGL